MTPFTLHRLKNTLSVLWKNSLFGTISINQSMDVLKETHNKSSNTLQTVSRPSFHKLHLKMQTSLCIYSLGSMTTSWTRALLCCHMKSMCCVVLTDSSRWKPQQTVSHWAAHMGFLYVLCFPPTPNNNQVSKYRYCTGEWLPTAPTHSACREWTSSVRINKVNFKMFYLCFVLFTGSIFREHSDRNIKERTTVHSLHSTWCGHH